MYTDSWTGNSNITINNEVSINKRASSLDREKITDLISTHYLLAALIISICQLTDI